MKNTLPPVFNEYWRGSRTGEFLRPEFQSPRPEELGKEWRELIEAIQHAAKKEWTSS
ncbi:hypothetical protein [Alkalihalobacterium elongatum]|uniref:hypothetical protein n=1 Tax=Alkalihalobacterium elongatum TaxID=2675466 RepID=UPI001C1FB5C7|nr:hypothetical protein [Alkalihalobacterium elongatum]